MVSPEESLELEFEPLSHRRSTLGQTISSISLAGENHPPDLHEDEEQDIQGISELLISKSYTSIRLRSIQRGTWDTTPAALLIFDVVFQPYTPDKYRFKAARFELTFEGQKDLIPHSTRPRVLSYAPTRATGEVTAEKKGWEFSTGIAASVPLPVSPEVNLSVTKTSEYTAEHRMVIQGATSPPSKPFRVWWTLNEKKLVREGLPHDVSFGVVVSCDGPFFVTFKTEAEVGAGSFSRGIISKKEKKYRKLIDPQREFGPQFGGSGVLDLKSLDLDSRYQKGNGLLSDVV